MGTNNPTDEDLNKTPSPTDSSGQSDSGAPPIQKSPSVSASAPHHAPIKHKKVWPVISILFVLIVGLGAILFSTQNVQKPQDTRSRVTVTGTTLALNPSAKTATIGTTFTVGITTNTDTDTISAAELHLTYDPTAIQIVSFAPGTILPVVLVTETHTNGVITVVLGAQPASPFKGAGIMGTWTVKILAAKQSSISFATTTRVAAIGKNTNALVSSAGIDITGMSINTPTTTPILTHTPIPTATPIPD